MATASSPAVLENKLKPVVVINKIDRENARPHKVMDEIFDLFVELRATTSNSTFRLSTRARRTVLPYANCTKTTKT